MNTIKTLSAIALLSLALTGCNSEAEHDVAYYKLHQDEMIKKLADCNDDPAAAKENGNCINALAAKRELQSEKSKKFINNFMHG